MRIAVLLTGICYSDDLERLPRDWRLCYENIINFFSDIKIDFYLTTYNSPFNEELVRVYNPKKILFLDYGKSTQRETLIKSLENVSEEDVDFIFCTRFDLHFNKKLTDLKIDYEKFNFLFKEKFNWDVKSGGVIRKFVTDNFFAFPIKYKSIFSKCILNLEDSFYKGTTSHTLPFLHHIFDGTEPKLCDSVEYNFIGDIEESSDSNSFYTIIRSKK
jgi:hypothetical protein